MGFFKYILDLGPSVMLAIILFIMGLCFRVKFSEALRSGLLVGVAFFGINMVIGAMVTTLSPVTDAFIKTTGIQLTVMDIGWPSAASITWAYSAAAFFIPLGLIVNAVLLLLRVTKTVDVDIWNYWVWGFSAAIIGTLTGNVIIGLVAFVITEIIILLIADLTAPKLQEYFDLPKISIPHGNAAPFAILAYGLEWVFERIPGFNKLNADSETIKRKFGVFGEPIFIGVLIGAIFSLVARYDLKGVLTTSISLGGVMVILPRMTKLLMEALTPISKAIGDVLRKRFPGKEFYIGLDAAVLAGYPEVMATGFVLIPIAVLIAMVLPGNKVLPFADLVGLTFVVSMTMPIYKGNIIRGIIGGSFIIVICLLIGTNMAPLFTQMASNAGVAVPKGSTGVMSFLSGTSPVTWIIKEIVQLLGL
jgi:PTS system galactitol-specific IIC component